MMDMNRQERVIRVHMAGVNTFVVETRDGIVTAVSMDEAKWMLEKSETQVAEWLRSRGATFVDLLRDKATVQVKREKRPKGGV